MSVFNLGNRRSIFNDNQVIIGLTGPKGSGKDLACQLIQAKFGDNWERVAFADPIKNTVANLFHIGRDLEGPLKEEFRKQTLDTVKRLQSVSLVDNQTGERYGEFTGRDLIRDIGMLMRGYNCEQFNNYVRNEIANHKDRNFIITDVRFDNEVKLIRQIGGVIIEIHRPGYEYDGHVTESGTIKGDYHVFNNGTVESFESQLDTVVSTILTDY